MTLRGNNVDMPKGMSGLALGTTHAPTGETEPKYLLSPQQTDGFLSLVTMIQQGVRLGVSAMPDISGMTGRSSSPTGNFAVDQIVVNVEQLADDQDYEELADKVFETLLERMQNGTAVGGLYSSM